MGVSATNGLPADLAAYRDLWRAAPADVAGRHGVGLHEVAGAVCLGCASMSGAPILNHVFGVGLRAPAGDAELDEIQRFYDGLGAAYSVAVDPAATGLAGLLERRGFSESRPWMTFRRRPGGDPAQEGLRIEEAGASRAEAFGAIVAAAFEMPPDFAGWMAALADRPGWTALLALDGDEPVGAGALFVDGRAAWLGMGATIPEHRGRGAQGALFAERLRRAEELGLDAVLTETGAPVGDEGPGPSYRNMLRFGFAEVALRPNLRSPG
jgi:GNAT superfamily N-acetyltransferase